MSKLPMTWWIAMIAMVVIVVLMLYVIWWMENRNR